MPGEQNIETCTESTAAGESADLSQVSEPSQTESKPKKTKQTSAQKKLDARIEELSESKLDKIITSFEDRLTATLDNVSKTVEAKLRSELDRIIDSKIKPESERLDARIDVVAEGVNQYQTTTSKHGEAIEALKAEVQSIKQGHTKASDDGNSHDAAELRQIQDKIDKLEKQCDVQHKMILNGNKELNEYIERVELHGRKLNLTFDGIDFSEGENCKEIVTNIIRSNLQLNIDPVDVAHRKYVARENDNAAPIVARFKTLNDKIRVLENCSKLKDTGIYVNPDYPRSYQERRSALFKELRHAKEADPTARVIRDRMRFRGKLYTADTIHLAGFGARDHTVASEDQVRFYGRHSVFSNFHPSPIHVRGTRFSCVEQCIMYGRAHRRYDYAAALRIQQLRDPAAMKRAGKYLKPKTDNDRKLEEVLIEEALYQKFTSNQALRDAIIATENRIMLECNPYDNHYGTGVEIADDKLANNTYEGKNVMGKLLMKVRDKIRHESTK